MKRKIALVCSTINGCAYCTAHQCSYLATPQGAGGSEAWGLTVEDLDALVSGDYVASDEIEAICIEFARAAAKDSSGVAEEIRGLGGK